MVKVPESQIRWMKENTVMINARLTKNTDADIIEYLQGKQKATLIKAAIREYMSNHPEE